MPQSIGVDAMSEFAYKGQKRGQSSMSAKIKLFAPALYARLFKNNDGLCGAEIWYTYS